jgi:uncharacterized protein YndB with AHSA1/START domain
MPAPAAVTTPSDREIRIVRGFDAPRELVFDAHTIPALLKRWYGPPGWQLIVCEIDLRPGGNFRYVTRQPSGREVAQSGVYSDVERPSLVANSEAWEDWNPGEVEVRSEFAAAGGGTLLTVTLLFPSREVRDQLIAHGMTDGSEASYRKLDAVLASGDHQMR